MLINSFTVSAVLVKDAELKQRGDKTKAEIRVGFSGSSKESLDFITVELWGKYAETMSNLLKKGKKVIVSGRLTLRSYQNKIYPAIANATVELVGDKATTT